MDTTLETRALTKRYGGTVAVDDLSIAVRPGRVTGFVGPNGAGKTTTMQLLLGLAAPDSGEALIGGRRYATIARPLTVVGALLDGGAVHPSRSARNHLRWLAQSNGIPTGRADEVLQPRRALERGRRRARTFSLGMRQRLGVAAALLGDPPILILDEPTIGLDPEGIQWMRETLRGFADEGRTVFDVEPPDERARGHRRPADRDRQGAAARRRLGRRADRRRVRGPRRDQDARRDGRHDRACECGRHGDLERTRPGRGRGDAGACGSRSCSLPERPRSKSSCRAGRRSRRPTSSSRATQGEHTSVAVDTGRCARMTATLLSEWTKLRTQRGTLVALGVMCRPDGRDDRLPRLADADGRRVRRRRRRRADRPRRDRLRPDRSRRRGRLARSRPSTRPG